ncbi:MAG: hypothetical protein KAH09_07170 [Desulfobacula sp.]|nr:hypothetical protein [Desulfobacula sp.]
MVLEKRGNDEKISHQYFKTPGKYSVIDHEKYFFYKKLSITHKANHYNPHSESSRYTY